MQMDSISEGVRSIPPTSLALALVIVLISIIYYMIKSRGLPPGPTGLPYFGYYPFFNEKTIQFQLVEFKKKYGDVFSFTCCGRLFINLGTFKAVREAHITKSDYFARRQESFSLINKFFGGGIVASQGEKWWTLRKYFLNVFKERGMISIKDSMSGTLYDSIRATVDILKAANGEEVNILEVMSLKCNTIIRQALFGEYGVTDEQILEINKYFGQVHQGFSPKKLLLMGNVAKYLIFPFQSTYRGAEKNYGGAKNIAYKLIEDHKSTYDEENIRDIIDEFFKEKDKRESNGDPTAKYFTDTSLMSALIQFVGDGGVNVAGFISVYLKYVAAHPEEQEKIYKEVADVVGTERYPTMEDKSKLTYTNAFLTEVLRTSDFMPFFPGLECTEETTVGGYRIPKGAITVTNMLTSHNDPEVYEEPEKFNPSRFIIQEGKRKPEFPITFGIGKRACMGEAFLMMQTFLFVTTLIQNFRLTVPKGNPESTHDMVLQRQFVVRAEPRKQN